MWAKHPTQLSPGTDTVAYSYDTIFGQLKGLTDLVGNRYAFAFDSLGRPRRITRFPVGLDSVYEMLGYDNDGRLSTRSVQTGATNVLSDALQYFGAGARVQAATSSDAQGPRTDQFTYSGLGGLGSESTPAGFQTYRVDALGNRTYADHGAGVQPDNYTYSAATGRLAYREEIRPPGTRGTGKDTTFSYYDNEGRLTFTDHRHYWIQLLGGCSTCSAGVEDTYTNSYYDPEGRLKNTESRLDSQPPFRQNFSPYVSTETYRYDALGRRVYTRFVRGDDCLNHQPSSRCKSFLTRTVWDGDQVLYEIRVNGDTGSSTLESDTPPPDSTHGVVGYLHAGGIDQPLALWKSGEPLVLPFANYRGAFVTGTCPVARCNTAFFPAGQWTAFGDPSVYPYGPPFWHGSIIDGGKDGSGYHYQRNRYYDPSSGRFTQEDPIGLAGGLNLHGFAGGDPVNFSDPFGLETYVNCRTVMGRNREKRGAFGHCAVRIVDKKRKIDMTIELIPKGVPLRNNMFWSSGEQSAKTQAYDPSKWVQVRTPDGMTKEQFYDAVCNTALIQTGAHWNEPYKARGSRNSNHFVYSIITGAGGEVPRSAADGFWLGAPGLCGGRGFRTGDDCSP